LISQFTKCSFADNSSSINDLEARLRAKTPEGVALRDFEELHSPAPPAKSSRLKYNQFPCYKVPGMKDHHKKKLQLKTIIQKVDDLLDIEDTGDYEEDFGLVDRSSEFRDLLIHDSLINSSSQLYNERTFCDFRELSSYSRRRAMLKGNAKLPNHEFEWEDILTLKELNIADRLSNLEFDDMMNIISGKISDRELNQLIFKDDIKAGFNNLSKFLQIINKKSEHTHDEKKKGDTLLKRKELKEREKTLKIFHPLFLFALVNKGVNLGLSIEHLKGVIASVRGIKEELNGPKNLLVYSTSKVSESAENPRQKQNEEDSITKKEVKYPHISNRIVRELVEDLDSKIDKK